MHQQTHSTHFCSHCLSLRLDPLSLFLPLSRRHPLSFPSSHPSVLSPPFFFHFPLPPTLSASLPCALYHVWIRFPVLVIQQVSLKNKHCLIHIMLWTVLRYNNILWFSLNVNSCVTAMWHKTWRIHLSWQRSQQLKNIWFGVVSLCVLSGADISQGCKLGV